MTYLIPLDVEDSVVQVMRMTRPGPHALFILFSKNGRLFSFQADRAPLFFAFGSLED